MASAMTRAARAQRVQDEIILLAEAMHRAKMAGAAQSFDPASPYADREWLKDIKIVDPIEEPSEAASGPAKPAQQRSTR